MKTSLQYINDVNGKTQAVQLPFRDWEKILSKLKKYEQALKLKSDLAEAYDQIETLKTAGKKQQTLSEFLDEL